jgi:palmitoyl-protein thioesterase
MARITKLLSLIAVFNYVSASAIINPKYTPDNDDDTPLPLVIWHGLGDDFTSDGLKEVASLAQEVNEGTFTYIIHLGDDASSEFVTQSNKTSITNSYPVVQQPSLET